MKRFDVTDLCHIYHKGDQPPRRDVAQWERLPNVGREAHTYLTHIVRNYERLSQVTLFLQGGIDDHIAEGNVYAHPHDCIRAAGWRGVGFARLDPYSNWGRIVHIGKWREELRSGKLRPAKLDFADFWRKLFRSEPPPTILTNYAACFAVDKARILNHPRSFYERALATVSDHINPEETHYFERLWYSIFTSGSAVPDKKAA
jgi:hypothetical protein